MIRAVVDTNVLVSALIVPSGNEALLLLAINQGFVEPCYSDEILQEYAEVLLRPRFHFSPDEIDEVLVLFRKRGLRLRSVPAPRVSPDPDDDKFIACALAAPAEFLVTGNKKHYPERALSGARVVSAGELLELIMLDL